MSTGTKTAGGTSIILGVLAMATIAVLFGSVVGRPVREEREENVVLEVRFEAPVPRTLGARVEASVDRESIHDFKLTNPTWIKSEWIPKGALVRLSVTNILSGNVTCIIRADGKLIQRTSSAEAICAYRKVG